jgi:hypothetical protein
MSRAARAVEEFANLVYRFVKLRSAPRGLLPPGRFSFLWIARALSLGLMPCPSRRSKCARIAPLISLKFNQTKSTIEGGKTMAKPAKAHPSFKAFRLRPTREQRNRSITIQARKAAIIEPKFAEWDAPRKPALRPCGRWFAMRVVLRARLGLKQRARAFDFF